MSLINHIKDLIIYLSLDGRIITVNPAVEDFIGSKSAELIGQQFKVLLDIFPLDLLTTAKLDEITTRLPIIDVEYACKNQHGDHHNVLWSVFPLLDANQITEGLILIGKDITELKKLAMEVARLDNIIKYTPGLVYWKDENSVYLGCNDEFANLAGLQSRTEVIGKTDFDLIWKEGAQQYVSVDKEVIKTGEAR